MSQDEQTTQPVASENTSGTEEETLESVSQEESLQVEESNAIPEKFIGKSAAEIVQYYRESERERGRLANELGETRKTRDDNEAKFRDLERQSMQYQPTPTQVPPQHQVPIQQEQDPLSAFDTQFEESPKEAIRDLIEATQSRSQADLQAQSMQQRSVEASEYYWNEKKNNSDYARRETKMQQIASEYGDIIRPEYLNSVKALKAIDLMSKGSDIDYYASAAVAKSQEDGLSVVEEKRRSQSESASSEGDSNRAFSSLSLKEMEQYLGESDK